ncbi:hypothetical protein MNBD_GAMMA10-786 [hydrothermal vent metagenome]|uniref:ATPase AAA-type core domain-containing protein n=1 Tax=hydrothermal vent metagenome TaxID=652676 RepID=A0A3B0XTG5_9ZZZZ
MNEQELSGKKNKSIRALENKALKNDINALFQLANYYEQGQYVEKNIKLAEDYYLKTVEIFKCQKFKISSLKLVNFRIFENLELYPCNNENSNLTVLIGNNGAGKTTILDSISICLSWLVKAITTKTPNGKSISSADITNNNLIEYASVLVKFSILENFDSKIELTKTVDGSNSKRSSYFQDIKKLASIYKLANEKNKSFNFPIMAFYSVERAVDIKNKDVISFDEIKDQKLWGKFDGYTKALTGAADFELFFNWFKYMDDINNENDNKFLMSTIKKLKAELEDDLFKEKLKVSEKSGEKNDFFISFKNKNLKEIAKLEKILNESERLQSGKFINNVAEAIYKFMPGFNNLRIQRSPSLKMLIDKNDLTLSVLQLSQGEKSMLALVADISRRLVLLNPSLENPLKGSGIVLIDEIDLHLHPMWQQNILPNLEKTFPNIQFIVSTHSPQVITTVGHESIKILRDGGLFSAPKGSKGAESSRVLKRLFNVETRPPHDSNTQDLAEYKILVYKDDWECVEALKLRNKLNNEFGGEEPDLVELDLYIENRIWEKKIEEDK